MVSSLHTYDIEPFDCSIVRTDKPAPEISIDYWRLPPDAKMVDVLYAVRSDESTHRFVNHSLANLDHEHDVNPFALREPDMLTKGKKIGTYVGRVAVRASGRFNIQMGKEVIQGIGHQYCTMVQRADGYGYWFNMDSTISAGAGHASRAALSLPGLNAGVSRAKAR